MARSKGFMASLFTSKIFRLVGGSILVIIVFVFIGSRLTQNSNQKEVKQIASSNLSQNSNNRDGEVLARTEINQSIEIPTGRNDDSINYSVVSAEITKSIIIQGQRASAKEGKQFLILNLKLSNDSERRVKIDARDYVRLSVNGNDDRLAPAIYNDIEVQPISDQFTRIGFSVFETDNNYVLYLGEISEDKIEIPLQFE